MLVPLARLVVGVAETVTKLADGVAAVDAAEAGLSPTELVAFTVKV